MPVTQRSLIQQLNLAADTYDTQRSILNGSPAARAPYMFVDAVLVGSADLAAEVFANEGGAFDIDFPPHMLDILGRSSMGTVNEPEHMRVRAATRRQARCGRNRRGSCCGAICA